MSTSSGESDPVPVLPDPLTSTDERYDLADQLHASQEIFRAAFDLAAIGMALVAPSGHWLKVNQALLRMTGYTEQELLQGTFQEITHPDDLKADLALTIPLFLGVLSHFQLEKRYVCKDGGVIWVHLNVALVRDAAGAPRFAISQVEDITPRKQAEFALKASEERYRTLVEQLPAIVYRCAHDAAYTPIYISPSVGPLLGPRVWDDFFRNKWNDRIHPDDLARVLEENSRAIEREHPFHAEYRFRKDDGSYVWLRDQSQLVSDEHGVPTAWHGICVDVTEQHQLRLELEQSRDAAEAANRLKSAFLSNMSHELRTPLNAITGYSYLMLDEVEGSLNPAQQGAMRQVTESADRLLGLVNDVLDLARVEAGGLELASEPIDLAAELRSVLAELAPLAGAKGLTVRIEIAPDLPGPCGDAVRVRQILLNLLGNAIKFTERGTIRVRANADGAAIRIAVQDTGIGIAPGVLPLVFEEFQQADSSTTRRYGGSGLGLAIAKGLAELHGGRIDVESTLNEGSTFTLVLPLTPEADAAVDCDD